jgi:hypothetical protein
VAVYEKLQVPDDTRRRARLPLAILAGVYALSCLLPMPGVDGRILHLPSICPFNALTGLPCPGCGLTRAFVCIAHGHLLEAVHWHPLAPVVFMAGIVALVDNAARWSTGRSLFPDAPRWRSRVYWGAAVVFLMFGLARMFYYASLHARF